MQQHLGCLDSEVAQIVRPVVKFVAILAFAEVKEEESPRRMLLVYTGDFGLVDWELAAEIFDYSRMRPLPACEVCQQEQRRDSVAS